MTDDPDELKMGQEISKRDPANAILAIEEIEVHLRYGIPTLKLIGYAVVVLLALILWRVW